MLSTPKSEISAADAARRVVLVGAGPGDPELLTLRGRRHLESADVVVYDELANPALLDFSPASARRIYVGKRAGAHSAQQSEIIEILLCEAQPGVNVVRLKGGDPFVFGRGGEEVEALRAANIAVEIVPGVTAATGAAAATQIPLTHREDASAVLFVTGHKCAANGGAPAVDWAAVSKLGATVVVYMGLREFPNIVEKLRLAGSAPALPIAIISNATLPTQSILITNLGDALADISGKEIPSPALLIIGDVVLRGKDACASLAATATS